MIEKIIKAMIEKNYEALALCFSENCVFYDYCPSLNGRENSYVYGKAGLEIHFRLQFVTGALLVAEPVIEDENSATFFGAYGGPYLYARLYIEEYDSSGFVKKAVVHPN